MEEGWRQGQVESVRVSEGESERKRERKRENGNIG